VIRRPVDSSHVPPDKQRILFVDDEPAILAGIQNLLFRERKRWDMVFANSGQEALAKIREGRFDVVVSDMRMPGLDGAALLNAILHEAPATARIVLSGQAEREAIVRVLPALHQLLSKPCDASTLRGAIERGLQLGTLPASIKTFIGKLDKLPSPPQMFRNLRVVIDDPRATAPDLAAVIEQDPAMCAKILQLVNSGYFGVGQPVTAIARAVKLLGPEPIRYLTLTTAVFSQIDVDLLGDVSVVAMQDTSLRTARLVRELCPGDDTAFAAALLHDIGRTALALAVADRYAEVAARVATGDDLLAAERAVLEVTHNEVGACVLELWGLPREICDVVRWHHAPWSAPEPLRTVAAAVYVAAAFVGGDAGAIDRDALRAAGLDDRVTRWIAGR
jgi:HD-like signal output (HDOD) protein/ActR/RegA family two-component response regulator